MTKAISIIAAVIVIGITTGGLPSAEAAPGRKHPHQGAGHPGHGATHDGHGKGHGKH